jgi:hypothetical protein
VAPFPNILLTTMDQYTPARAEDYYNRSFTIVQSSGMGKSRLVDHSAKSRFTFPFNLHEKLPSGSRGIHPHACSRTRLIRFLTSLSSI